MNKTYFFTLLSLATMLLSACVGQGYHGAEVPNLDKCYPGHETSKDCHNRRHIDP